MPLTFVAFLFSTLAIAGVPPFIGFWSKDLIVTELFLAGQNFQVLLMLLASVLTSFYMFRALFKLFFGPESKLAVEKDLHESPKIMTVPLLILCACVLVLGFSEDWAAYLLGGTASHSWIVFSLSIIGASMMAILVGFAPSYMSFYAGKPNPKEILQAHPVLGSIRTVVLEGYGFDALYLAVFVRPFSKISAGIRSIQTGILGKNLWPILAVLFLLMLWIVMNP
jgi:NADH-quinone oxidoreductase subunit L